MLLKIFDSSENNRGFSTSLWQVVEAVLRSGKVRNVKDSSGRLAATLAMEHGKRRVVPLLERMPSHGQ